MRLYFNSLGLGLTLPFAPHPASFKRPSKSGTFSDFLPQIALLTWEVGIRKLVSHYPRGYTFSEVFAYWTVSGQGEARSL